MVLEYGPEDPLWSQVFPLGSHIPASTFHIISKPRKVNQISKSFSSASNNMSLCGTTETFSLYHPEMVSKIG